MNFFLSKINSESFQLAMPREILNKIGLKNCKITSVMGGDINSAYKIETAEQKIFFMKMNNSAPADMFYIEKKSLHMLHAYGLNVPRVIDVADNFLLLEWISLNNNNYSILGENLAHFHLNSLQDNCGLDFNTYCGTTLQPNENSNNWPNYFSKYRIEYLYNKITKNLSDKSARIIKSFIIKMPGLLPVNQSSLLHGDLWAGNVLGKSFIDPAIYFGNREADIAMTNLFGGFNQEFYDSYNSVFPLEGDFRSRSEIYNLFHQLNHYYLFKSSGYLNSALAVMKKYI